MRNSDPLDDEIDVVRPAVRDGKLTSIVETVTRGELYARLEGRRELEDLRRDRDIRLLMILDPGLLQAWVSPDELAALVEGAEGTAPSDPEETIDIFCGCSACGKTTRITGTPVAQLVFPRGLAVACPGCRQEVGTLTFSTKRELLAALENPPTAEPRDTKILFFNVVPDLRYHHPDDEEQT